MRRFQTIIILYICGCFSLASQVGINITEPIGVLHIDPRGDTSGDLNSSDDIVIMEGAKVGIGTLAPKANLDIKGTLRIVNGSQANKTLLTSTADGVGLWQRKIIGVLEYGITAGASARVPGGNVPSNMGAYITLPEGNWQVNLTATFVNNNSSGCNITWDLSTSQTVDDRIGRVLSAFSPARTYSVTTANYFVSHTTTTTYYVWAFADNLPAGLSLEYSGEVKLWALQIK